MDNLIWYVVPFSENDAHCEKQKKYDVGHCQSSEAPVKSHSGVTLVSELISWKRAEQTEESHSEVGWLALSHNLLQERWKLVGSIKWSLIFSPEVSHISPSLCQCQCMRPPSPFVIWTAVCCTKYFFLLSKYFYLEDDMLHFSSSACRVSSSYSSFSLSPWIWNCRWWKPQSSVQKLTQKWYLFSCNGHFMRSLY